MEDNFKNLIQSKFDNLEGTPPIGGFNAIKNNIKSAKPESNFQKYRKYLLIPFLFLISIGLFLGGYFVGQNSVSNTINTTSNLTNSIELNSLVVQNEIQNTTQNDESSLINHSSAENELFFLSKQNKLKEISEKNTSKNRAKIGKLVANNNFIDKNATYEGNENESTLFTEIINGADKMLILPLFSSNSINSDNTIWGEEVFLPKMDTKLLQTKALDEVILEDSNDIKKKRFSYGFYASALNTNKRVVSNLNDDVLIADFQKINTFNPKKYSFDVGIDVNYALTRKLLVGIGFDFTQLNDQVTCSMLNNNQELLTTEKVSNTMLKLNYTDRTNVHSQDVKLFYGTINTHFEYLLTPKWSLIAGVGFSKSLANFFPSEQNAFINNSNINSRVALAYNTPISEQWKVQIQPTFSYYFKNSIEREYNFKPTNFGIRLNFIKI